MDEADKGLGKPKNHTQTVIVLTSRGKVALSEGLDDRYEEVITEKGQVLNPSFLDYGIPTAMETPSINSVDVETNDPEGPFGAKESGEGTQLSPAPAIINAIYGPIGVRFKNLPVTPEKVLEALHGKER